MSDGEYEESGGFEYKRYLWVFAAVAVAVVGFIVYQGRQSSWPTIPRIPPIPRFPEFPMHLQQRDPDAHEQNVHY